MSCVFLLFYLPYSVHTSEGCSYYISTISLASGPLALSRCRLTAFTNAQLYLPLPNSPPCQRPRHSWSQRRLGVEGFRAGAPVYWKALESPPLTWFYGLGQVLYCLQTSLIITEHHPKESRWEVRRCTAQPWHTATALPRPRPPHHHHRPQYKMLDPKSSARSLLAFFTLHHLEAWMRSSNPCALLEHFL